MLNLKNLCLSYSKKLLFGVFFFTVALCFSQERDNYSLLWKIEDVNSSKPSYLFGTMHVTDARAFKFSDAVLKAIEDTELFALEVSPDSMLTAINAVLKKPLDLNVFKSVLKKKEYKKLQERFEEVNGYKLEDAQIGDPQMLLQTLIPERERDDDKVTFLDAHLYTQARTMQKPIVGLELISAQLGYFDEMSDANKRLYILDHISEDTDYYKGYLEELTKIYHSGDIKEVEKILVEHDAINDASLVSRNEYMSNSIAKFMKEKSIFSAVGAAHLPGENGIIEILRRKGFKVSLVDPVFTGVADNYKVDFNKMLWYKHENKDLGYTLEIPSKPNDSLDFKVFNIYSHKGIMSDETLSFFALDARKIILDDKSEAFISKIIKNITEQLKGEIIKKDTLKIAEGFGYETLARLTDSSLVKSKVVVKNKILYYLFVNADKEEPNSDYSNRFFKSLQYTTPAPLPKAEEKVWTPYKNTDGAFEVMLPTKVKDLSRTTPNPEGPEASPYEINLFSAVDYENDNNYLIRYNDMPLGYYLEDLAAGYAGIEENLKLTSTIVGDVKNIEIQGYKGKEYELILQNKYHAICRIYFKGNRVYLLLMQKLNETDKVNPDNTFFNSFKIIDNKASELTRISPNETFSVLSFNNHKSVEDNSIEDLNYYGDAKEVYQINDANGDVGYLSYNNLKRYFRTKTLEEFYKINVEAIATYRDTIISESRIKVNGVDAVQVVMKNKLTGLFYRHQFWVDDNRLYQMYIYAEEANTKNKLADSIFSSFKSLKKRKGFDIYTSKTDLILKDLKSKDTLVLNSAIGAFSYYEFEKEDIDKLFKSLTASYSKAYDAKIKETIISEFSNVNDATTIKKLADVYLKELKSDALRIEVLNTIKNLDYEDAIPTYINLFNTIPPSDNENHTWNVLSPFKDSLALSVNNYESLLRTLPLKDYRSDILDISTSIIKDSVADASVVENNLDKILQYAESDVNDFIKQLSDTEVYADATIIQLYLALFSETTGKKDIVDAFTKKLVNLDEQKWVEFLALKARLHNELPVDKKLIKATFEDLYTRFELIEYYHKSKQLSQVPETYLDPVEMAKLSLYNYIGEDNGYPETITLLEKFSKDGEAYASFEFAYKEDKDTYIGIVGPIETITEDSKLKRTKCYTDWETKQEDWKAQTKKMMESFKENAY